MNNKEMILFIGIQASGKTTFYHEQLAQHEHVSHNDLPNWQKRGIGVYFQDVEKEGYNPMTKTAVQTTRRELTADYDLILGREYGEWVAAFADYE